jgi:CubicO group peptidase (beta-lactamase class C family)
MIEGPKASDWVAYALSTPFPHSCANPTPVATAPNRRAWRAAEIPGGNGHGTAAALATIYGMMAAGGGTLVSKSAIDAARAPLWRGTDESFGSPTAFARGYQIEDATYAGLASAATFGHTGWGGAIGFADPEAGLGFGYVTNRMLGFDDGIDPRRRALIEAAYAAL